MADEGSDSPQLAELLLAEALPRRWVHSQAVAARAAWLCSTLEVVPAEVVDAAWLHDIGYSPALASTGFHPLDGARYLRDEAEVSERVVALVAHHSGAVVEARNRGLLGELLAEFPLESAGDLPLVALTFCDMTTGPSGERMTVDERLAEILDRYPPDDLVHRSIAESSEAIRLACARIEELLAQVG